MEQKFLNLLHNSFNKLVEKHGFNKTNEINEGQTYSVEYSSKTFVIKLEHYRVEFYATLYKAGHPNNEVELTNLLSYLDYDVKDYLPKSNPFKKANLEDCYREEFANISTIIDEYFGEIDSFFKRKDIDREFSRITEFMLKKHPDLFKRQ